MIVPAQLLRVMQPLKPFCERTVVNGKSFGLSSASYDIRIAQDVILPPGEFVLASSMERFEMPDTLLGIVHDKSTWARRGIAVQNTVIDPGWCGYLTIELTNHATNLWGHVKIFAGEPIAQIVFHLLAEPTQQPYSGKYQNQAYGPQPARAEGA